MYIAFSLCGMIRYLVYLLHQTDIVAPCGLTKLKCRQGQIYWCMPNYTSKMGSHFCRTVCLCAMHKSCDIWLCYQHLTMSNYLCQITCITFICICCICLSHQIPLNSSYIHDTKMNKFTKTVKRLHYVLDKIKIHLNIFCFWIGKLD